MITSCSCLETIASETIETTNLISPPFNPTVSSTMAMKRLRSPASPEDDVAETLAELSISLTQAPGPGNTASDVAATPPQPRTTAQKRLRLRSPESEEILAETAEVLYQVFGECSPPDRRTPDHASVRRWLSGLTGDDWNRDRPVTSPPHTSTTPLEITPRTVTPPPSSPDKPAGRVTRARTRARKAKKKIIFID